MKPPVARWVVVTGDVVASRRLAAKSIARFKELEDRAFAEYYLVGTLMSVAVATGGYRLLRQPL